MGIAEVWFHSICQPPPLNSLYRHDTLCYATLRPLMETFCSLSDCESITVLHHYHLTKVLIIVGTWKMCWFHFFYQIWNQILHYNNRRYCYESTVWFIKCFLRQHCFYGCLEEKTKWYIQFWIRFWFEYNKSIGTKAEIANAQTVGTFSPELS